MNPFKEQWIKVKIAEMQPEDLLYYGRVFGIPITLEEASHILHVVRSYSWSLNDKASHQVLFDAVEKGVSPETMKGLKQLYYQYME
ncbi:DUF2624 family protein [Salibacterium sp. K-3]